MTAPPRARRHRADHDRNEDVENSPINSHGTSSESEDIEISADMSVDDLYKVRFTSFERSGFEFSNVT